MDEKIGNDHARFLMGTIFLVYSYVSLYVCRMPKCIGGITWSKGTHYDSLWTACKKESGQKTNILSSEASFAESKE